MSDEGSSSMAGPGKDDSSSTRRLAAGELPPEATRRLRELGEAGAFSSDLSVADFALCHRLGLKPLSQVMGTSVYQVGYQPLWEPGWETTELRTISAAWNEARDRAFARLAHEAQAVGASAVVGVDVESTVGDWGETGGYGAIQYLVTGTAVSRSEAPGGHSRGRGPVLTELSIADYAKLVEAGIEPVGIVAWTAVFYVSLYYRGAEQPLLGGVAFQNFEYREVTQCFYTARERVTAELGRQAMQLGATGIVGVRIRHTTAAQSVSTPGMGARPGVTASFSAIGTAVRERGDGKPRAPMVTMDMTAVG